ncbi:hypothetical protein EVAR_5366_1 [Eumeta japonica]|uniref:Uncharacterized protein n=1 Tax=Eumeta variegata TaxID=151549 RepID=A0A4C1TNB1_EUMVA|nr:hypothetical protein EVAR_5366_1 [Eumeta japonica]
MPYPPPLASTPRIYHRSEQVISTKARPALVATDVRDRNWSNEYRGTWRTMVKIVGYLRRKAEEEEKLI